jgi:hypothetical protein
VFAVSSFRDSCDTRSSTARAVFASPIIPRAAGRARPKSCHAKL